MWVMKIIVASINDSSDCKNNLSENGEMRPIKIFNKRQQTLYKQ